MILYMITFWLHNYVRFYSIAFACLEFCQIFTSYIERTEATSCYNCNLTVYKGIFRLGFLYNMTSVNPNILYKYESMRVKWCRSFEEESPRVARSIKNFFQYFYRNHRNFNFVVGQMFDGTIHLLVKPRNYRQIKEEIEEQIGETLPEVAQIRDVTVLRKRKTFQDFQSFKDFCNSLRDENSEIVRR